MKYTPVWKDIDLTLGTNAVDFTIKKDGEWLHSGRAVAYPSENVAKLNINHFLEEDLNPEFGSDIREADDDVVTNPDAYGEFEVRDENDGLLEKYCVLYDWSYEDNWTGQTRYLMSDPINGHLDPRMRMMCTLFNTGETSVRYGIDNFFSVSPDYLLFNTQDRATGATKSVSVFSSEAWEATISGYTGFSITNVTSNGFDVRLASGNTVERTAVVTVTSPEHTAIVNVKVNPSLVATPLISDDASYCGGGNGYNINIWSDGDWYLDTAMSTSNLVLTPSAGTSGNTAVNIIAPLNTGATAQYLSSYLVDAYGYHISGVFRVVTHPYYTASTSPSYVLLTSAGTGQQITVNTNSTISAVTPSETWISAYNVQSKSFYVSASTNTKAIERTGTTTVSINNSSYITNLGVYQTGKTIPEDSNYIDYYAWYYGEVITPNVSGTSAYWGANLVENKGQVVSMPGYLMFDDSVTMIPTGAFSGSTALTEVTIPSEVASVGTRAFSGCTNLTTINCKAMTAPTLGTNVFSGIGTPGELHIYANADNKYYTKWLPALPSGWTIVTHTQ